MNYWIVKGRPSENDFDAWLRPGNVDRWRTQRPPAHWAVGDRLFFWKTAPDRCIVGLGEIVRLGRRQPRGTETLFGVKYLTSSLAQPVGIDTLRADCVVGNASFLKSGPSSTLYPLSMQQGGRLYAIVRRSNPSVRDAWRDLIGSRQGMTSIAEQVAPQLQQARLGAPALTALSLVLHQRYSRREIYREFGIKFDQRQRHLTAGLSPQLNDGGYCIFITLDKTDFDSAYDYEDELFADRLRWVTRRDRSEEHPDYVALRDPDTRVSLFVRNADREDVISRRNVVSDASTVHERRTGSAGVRVHSETVRTGFATA